MDGCTYTNVRTHARAHMRTHMWIQPYTHTHTHIQEPIHLHTHVYTRARIGLVGSSPPPKGSKKESAKGSQVCVCE